MSKGASLIDSAPGGLLDDVDATIVSASTGPYTYPTGTAIAGALIVKFVTADGEEHTEAYSSGAAAPTEDGTGFESTPKDNSKAKRFIIAMLKLNYPNIGADVSVFNGAKVHLKREALPKMPGLDKEGDKEKTVLLPVKIVSLPGEGRTSAKGAGSRPATATPATAATAASSNGELDDATETAVQEALAEAPENSLGRVKLGTNIMLKLTKAKNPNMAAIKKLAQDAAWLQAHAENGGWSVSGDTVKLG